MTAKVLSLEIERVRHQRAKKGAAQHDTRALEAKSHSSIRQFELARDNDDSARVFCAEEGHVGGNLSQLTTGTLQGAAVYLSAWSAATALAALILHQTQVLLHLALRLSSNSLTVGGAQCRSGNREPIANEITEKFSQ
jgi:hypothetical protein